jgi:tripartite-type tricarboxylate transporter receptor subunit TctC
MRKLSTFVAAAVVSSLGISLYADRALAEWPEQPIRLVVPFSPGGSTDITARVLAEKLSPELGQQVIVDNRPGAAGNIASSLVARAKPDGYTLLMATSTTQATNPNLYSNLTFDPIKDLAPVSQTAFVPNILVVSPSLPVKDLGEFLAYVKANPAKLNYGSSGSGSSLHLAAELFKSMAGVDIVHIPYPGSAPALRDVLAGQVQVVFSPLVEAIPYIEGGRMKALAVTTQARIPLYPKLPTIGEAIPGYEIALWNGILAPGGTPKPIIDRIYRALDKILRTQEMKEKLAQQGSLPVGSTPEEFSKFVVSEIDKWGKLVKISGARVD